MNREITCREKNPPESPKTSRTAKVLILSIGNSIAMLASIASGMVAARYLSKADYATIRQTFLAYEFVAPLLMLGLPNALHYCLPRNNSDRRGILIDNITLLLIGGGVFSLFILLGGNYLLAGVFNNENLEKTLSWMAVYPLIIMPVAGMGAVLVFSERVRVLAIYNTITSLIIACLGIFAIVSSKSYEIPVLMRIWVPAIFLPFAIYLMFVAVPGDYRMPRWGSMTAMLRYSVPLGFATMLGTLTIQLHSVIVAAMCSPTDFAVYINGAAEIPIIGIVTGSISTVAFAEMSIACAKKDNTTALAIFRSVSIKSASILFPTMCFFLVAAEQFIIILYSKEYLDSVVPFIIYLGILPARIVVYGTALMALGMTRLILIRSIFDLIINGFFCYIFVNIFGYVGAALSLVATLYTWTIPFNLSKISDGFGVRWTELLPWGAIGRTLAISLMTTPLPILFFKFSIFSEETINFLVAMFAYGIVTTYFLYRAGLFELPHGLIKKFPLSLRKKCE